MRAAATFISHAYAIKITQYFGRLGVTFIAILDARPPNRLTLSVMILSWLRLDAPAVEGGKADNYNLRWLLLLLSLENVRTVRRSFSSRPASCAWVRHCGPAALLQFASGTNGTFLWKVYKGCVDERKLDCLNINVTNWLTNWLTDWLTELTNWPTDWTN